MSAGPGRAATARNPSTIDRARDGRDGRGVAAVRVTLVSRSRRAGRRRSPRWRTGTHLKPMVAGAPPDTMRTPPASRADERADGLRETGDDVARDQLSGTVARDGRSERLHRVGRGRRPKPRSPPLRARRRPVRPSPRRPRRRPRPRDGCEVRREKHRGAAEPSGRHACERPGDRRRDHPGEPQDADAERTAGLVGDHQERDQRDPVTGDPEAPGADHPADLGVGDGRPDRCQRGGDRAASPDVTGREAMVTLEPRRIDAGWQAGVGRGTGSLRRWPSRPGVGGRRAGSRPRSTRRRSGRRAGRSPRTAARVPSSARRRDASPSGAASGRPPGR